MNVYRMIVIWKYTSFIQSPTSTRLFHLTSKTFVQTSSTKLRTSSKPKVSTSFFDDLVAIWIELVKHKGVLVTVTSEQQNL